jgi:hypothetical protein
MYRVRHFCILITGFAMLALSCSVLEPSIPAASYIHIDSIPLVLSDTSDHGSNSNNITDAWVIDNNEFLGTFPLPADIPVLKEGSHKFTIRAGIIENGIAGLRSAYPKYSSYDTTINLVANQKFQINPVVDYQSGLQFPQIEDFDDASLSLIATNVTNSQLSITGSGDADAFEGNSGKVTLDSNHPLYEDATDVAFALPLNVPTYLELNYKCENEFKIGMFITTPSGVVQSELLTIKKSGSWKKVYVSLSDLGGVQSGATAYKLYLRAEKSADLSVANIFFDNLKVVY